jgi:hypothetical protein
VKLLTSRVLGAAGTVDTLRRGEGGSVRVATVKGGGVRRGCGGEDGSRIGGHHDADLIGVDGGGPFRNGEVAGGPRFLDREKVEDE